MSTVLAALPPEFLQVRFSERMTPGREPELGLTEGSNCQRYAYAVLRHFGLSVPDLRSSELWADEELLTTVSEPEPLDLVLFAANPDPWGAHVGVYLGGVAVLHLCKEVGVPIVWDFNDFAERERYRSLIGFKRVRTSSRRPSGGRSYSASLPWSQRSGTSAVPPGRRLGTRG